MIYKAPKSQTGSGRIMSAQRSPNDLRKDGREEGIERLLSLVLGDRMLLDSVLSL